MDEEKVILKDNNFFTGDFNGDGITDVFYYSTDTWKINFNKNHSVFEEVQYPNIFSPINDNSLFLVSDINGDGKSDVIEINYSPRDNVTTIYYYTFNGINFLKKQHPLSGWHIFFSQNLGYDKIEFADFDGDGDMDMFVKNNINNKVHIVDFGFSTKEGLLTTIQDGYNRKIIVDYAMLTSGAPFYIKSTVPTIYPLINFNMPLYTVKFIVSPDGIGGYSATFYFYEGGVAHNQGKGFLGFTKITAENNVANRKTISISELNTTYFVMQPKKIEVKDISTENEIDISTVDFTNATPHDFGNKRFYPFVEKTVSKDHLTDITTTEDFIINTDGNLTEHKVSYGATGTTTNTNVYCTFGSWWIPSRVCTTTVKKKIGSEADYERTIAYTYDNLGRMKTQITDPEPGKVKSVTTTFEYNNPFGNLSKTTISSKDLDDRFEKIEFDANGRFITKRTNTLGQFSTAEYEPVFGNIKKQTGIDGLVVRNEYDVFGRLIKTVTPDGNTITTTRGWSIGTPAHAVYFMETKADGAPSGKAFYDILGRELRTETEGFSGNMIVEKEYNPKGQLTTVKQNYASDPERKTIYDYHPHFGYVQSVNINGKITYYSVDGKTTTISNQATQIIQKIIDNMGNLVSVEDNIGGKVEYTYYSSGLSHTITSNGTTTTMEYDEYARQTKLIDANAGTIDYIYNAFGELESQTDTKGTVSMVYDELGRITSQTGPEGPTNYSYFETETGNNQIMKIETPEGNDVLYDYDGFGRNIAIHETIDGNVYTTRYEYDRYSNPIKTIYPSGFSVERSFDSKSYLTQINNSATGKMIWKADAMNGLGQYTHFTQGNQIQTIKTLNEFGMTENIKAGSVQDMHFKWDKPIGNLEEREDKLKNLKETFLYDDLNRLNTSTVGGQGAYIYSYMDNGNIYSKTGVGTYSYDPTTKPNAVTSITTSGESLSSVQQCVDYTSFNKVKKITENNFEYIINYGVGNQRKKSELKQSGTTIRVTIYAGNYEKITIGAEIYEVHYVAGGDGLSAINVRHNGTDQMFYVYTDHLGSILKLTDESGTVLYEQNYDAWGRNRNPNDWSYDLSSYTPPTLPLGTFNPSVWLIRGFTGHEHLSEFSLINMNGRVYDPVVARFLSPDNYVQAPDFTQGYNRYSYALNNPLVYVDPRGENPLLIAAAIYFVFFTETGYDLQKYVSPVALHVDINYSTHKKGIGIDVSAGMPQILPISVRGHIGVSYYSENYGMSGWEGRYGAEVGFLGAGNIGFTYYDAAGSKFDQRVGHLTLGIPGFNLKYANDWFFGLPLGDNGDRYRTAAAKLQLGPFDVGINLFTGDPGLDPDDRAVVNNKYVKGNQGNDPDEFRFGVGYVGFGPFRWGSDTETRRNDVQNLLIHDKFSGSPHFKVLDKPDQLYFGFFGGGSLW